LRGSHAFCRKCEPLLHRARPICTTAIQPNAKHWKTTMLISLIRMVRDYLRRRAVLAEIAHLDDRTLRDIGLSRRQLPATWGCE
jgi:uncharacterized protein YjiS (DUF1127 family)